MLLPVLTSLTRQAPAAMCCLCSQMSSVPWMWVHDSSVDTLEPLEFGISIQQCEQRLTFPAMERELEPITFSI